MNLISNPYPLQFSARSIKPSANTDLLFSSCYNSLKGQVITPILRTRMVDWMIEALTKLNCSGNTFFLSVYILDKYLKKGPKAIPPEKLLLIGSTSMVLASKFEDVQPISIPLARKCLVHNKHTEQELISMELEICTIIEFDFLVPLCTDYLGLLCSQLSIPFIISRSAELILIINRLEYNNFYPPFEEASAALILVSKTLNQFSLSDQIKTVSGLPEDLLEISIIGLTNQFYSYKLAPVKFKLVFKELGFAFESVEHQKIFKFTDQTLEQSQLNLINYV